MLKLTVRYARYAISMLASLGLRRGNSQPEG